MRGRLAQLTNIKSVNINFHVSFLTRIPRLVLNIVLQGTEKSRVIVVARQLTWACAASRRRVVSRAGGRSLTATAIWQPTVSTTPSDALPSRGRGAPPTCSAAGRRSSSSTADSRSRAFALASGADSHSSKVSRIQWSRGMIQCTLFISIFSLICCCVLWSILDVVGIFMYSLQYLQLTCAEVS